MSAPPTDKPDGFATASVIVGALSLLGCCFLLIPPFVGAILGIIAMRRTPRSQPKAVRMAVTGVAINGFLCAALPILLAAGIMVESG